MRAKEAKKKMGRIFQGFILWLRERRRRESEVGRHRVLLRITSSMPGGMIASDTKFSTVARV